MQHDSFDVIGMVLGSMLAFVIVLPAHFMSPVSQNSKDLTLLLRRAKTGMKAEVRVTSAVHRPAVITARSAALRAMRVPLIFNVTVWSLVPAALAIVRFAWFLRALSENSATAMNAVEFDSQYTSAALRSEWITLALLLVFPLCHCAAESYVFSSYTDAVEFLDAQPAIAATLAAKADRERALTELRTALRAFRVALVCGSCCSSWGWRKAAAHTRVTQARIDRVTAGADLEDVMSPSANLAALRAALGNDDEDDAPSGRGGSGGTSLLSAPGDASAAAAAVEVASLLRGMEGADAPHDDASTSTIGASLARQRLPPRLSSSHAVVLTDQLGQAEAAARAGTATGTPASYV